MKFKSLLLRQGKSLKPQWFQAFSVVMLQVFSLIFSLSELQNLL